MQVGFVIRIRDGQVEIQFHGRRPEDPRSLATHAKQGLQHAILMGRLTYRSELVEQLPPELVPADRDSDAALALAAYRCWGAAGLTRLEGCYALVVWDGENHRLLGSRDPFGGYPLFWTMSSDGLAMGTCQQPLVQMLPRRSLNPRFLADFLALPGDMFSEPASEECAYEGVHRVGPGCIVEALGTDGPIEHHRYWNWLERIDDPGTDRLEDLGELVGAGLRRAVAENMRGKVASHLSGGMDSTAIALLARDLLRGAAGGPDLHAFSLVFDELGGLARETPYLESALEQPGMVAHRVPADNLLDYDSFVQPPFHDEPFGLLWRFGLLAKLAAEAAAVGADTLMTGYAAEAMVDQGPEHLADLVRGGRFWSAWHDARAWGQADNRSAWFYLWAYGLKPLLPASWRHPDPGAAAPWIRPKFARAHELRERELRQQAPLGPSANLSVILSTLPSNHGDCIRWYAAAPLGVEIVHPFLDTRFARLCLGIQGRFRQDPWTQKPLLAQAMRDVLPALIRNRRGKGHYNALVHSGLARNLPVLEELVREAPVDDLGAFDKDVLIQCLQQAALGYIPGNRMNKLNLTLAWLRWRSLQDEWQKPCTPTAVLHVGAVARTEPTTTSS